MGEADSTDREAAERIKTGLSGLRLLIYPVGGGAKAGQLHGWFHRVLLAYHAFQAHLSRKLNMHHGTLTVPSRHSLQAGHVGHRQGSGCELQVVHWICSRLAPCHGHKDVVSAGVSPSLRFRGGAWTEKESEDESGCG